MVGGFAALGLAVALPLLLARKRAVPKGLVDEPSGHLSILPGFEVKVLSRTGDAMSDGLKTPGMPDGMGVFQGPSRSLVIMRNHELSSGQQTLSAYAPNAVPAGAFSTDRFGGVTRLVVHEDQLALLSQNLVLAGTSRNCAGGTSPWGWISCEEDADTGHGWAFLCDPQASVTQPFRKVDVWGRFRREAAAVDEITSDVYQTEDQPDGCLYRARAVEPRGPSGPPKCELEALVVVGQAGTERMKQGDKAEARWTPVGDDVLAQHKSLRESARKAGASTFARGEGVAARVDGGKPLIVFTATSGGPAGRGQLFALRPTKEGGEIEVLADARDGVDLDMPDNICFGPDGTLFIAEDGSEPNGVRVLTKDGRVLTLCVSRLPGEIAGVCLSPRGDTLFLNLQNAGVTLAIRGPFAQLV